MIAPYSRFPDNCRPYLISLRLEQEWKQSDVAEMAYISRSGYAQLESGIREGTPDQWATLSRIFCQPPELLKMRREEYFNYLRENGVHV